MRALGVTLLLCVACTAVTDDFSECEYTEPRTFDTPPCGSDYAACANACGGSASCERDCLAMFPECDACITDTWRSCSDEVFDCEIYYQELICCVEGRCPLTNPNCEACQTSSDNVSACWRAADAACRPVVTEVCAGLAP